tara:strand:+ start:92 stop:433 length:342 start_codon:yes stop_codon:yes gene_type:complete
MIFLNKGDKPLRNGELESMTQALIDVDWPQWKRERSIRKNDGEFNTFIEEWETDMDENRAIDLFNAQLNTYRKAVAALEDSSTDEESRNYHQSFIDKTPTEVIEFYDAEGGNE